MKAAGHVVLAVGTALVVIVLREETMSRHTPVDPHTELHVLVHASSNVADAKLPDMVTALFLMCELEVAGDPAGPVNAVGSDRFLLRLRPSLDHSDRLQLTGCLEDARIDRLQASVHWLRHVDAGPQPAPLAR